MVRRRVLRRRSRDRGEGLGLPRLLPVIEKTLKERSARSIAADTSRRAKVLVGPGAWRRHRRGAGVDLKPGPHTMAIDTPEGFARFRASVIRAGEKLIKLIEESGLDEQTKQRLCRQVVEALEYARRTRKGTIEAVDLLRGIYEEYKRELKRARRTVKKTAEEARPAEKVIEVKEKRPGSWGPEAEEIEVRLRELMKEHGLPPAWAGQLAPLVEAAGITSDSWLSAAVSTVFEGMEEPVALMPVEGLPAVLVLKENPASRRRRWTIWAVWPGPETLRSTIVAEEGDYVSKEAMVKEMAKWAKDPEAIMERIGESKAFRAVISRLAEKAAYEEWRGEALVAKLRGKPEPAITGAALGQALREELARERCERAFLKMKAHISELVRKKQLPREEAERVLREMERAIGKARLGERSWEAVWEEVRRHYSALMAHVARQKRESWGRLKREILEAVKDRVKAGHLAEEIEDLLHSYRIRQLLIQMVGRDDPLVASALLRRALDELVKEGKLYRWRRDSIYPSERRTYYGPVGEWPSAWLRVIRSRAREAEELIAELARKKPQEALKLQEETERLHELAQERKVAPQTVLEGWRELVRKIHERYGSILGKKPTEEDIIEVITEWWDRHKKPITKGELARELERRGFCAAYAYLAENLADKKRHVEWTKGGFKPTDEHYEAWKGAGMPAPGKMRAKASVEASRLRAVWRLVKTEYTPGWGRKWKGEMWAWTGPDRTLRVLVLDSHRSMMARLKLPAEVEDPGFLALRFTEGTYAKSKGEVELKAEGDVIRLGKATFHMELPTKEEEREALSWWMLKPLEAKGRIEANAEVLRKVAEAVKFPTVRLRAERAGVKDRIVMEGAVPFADAYVRVEVDARGGRNLKALDDVFDAEKLAEALAFFPGKAELSWGESTKEGKRTLLTARDAVAEALLAPKAEEEARGVEKEREEVMKSRRPKAFAPASVRLPLEALRTLDALSEEGRYTAWLRYGRIFLLGDEDTEGLKWMAMLEPESSSGDGALKLDRAGLAYGLAKALEDTVVELDQTGKGPAEWRIDGAHGRATIWDAYPTREWNMPKLPEGADKAMIEMVKEPLHGWRIIRTFTKAELRKSKEGRELMRRAEMDWGQLTRLAAAPLTRRVFLVESPDRKEKRLVFTDLRPLRTKDGTVLMWEKEHLTEPGFIAWVRLW